MRPQRRLDPVWMLLPSLGFLALFFFYPLGRAVYDSLYDWDLLTPPRWVGFGNYAALVRSGELAQTLWTTLSYSLFTVTGSMTIGLGLALLLDRRGALYAFARAAVFSAYVVSWVSVALLWLWMLDADAGIVDRVLRAFGLPEPRWLGDPDIALAAVAGVTVWKIAGYSMVLFLAGLRAIPESVLEAAAMDGAGVWRRFAAVSWPLLRPTTAFVATTSLILSFQVFDVVRVMTQGGPVRATNVLVYAIYEQIFLDLRVGRASALVVVFFVVLALLTALQLWGFRRREAV
jgi:sn-glycerol 3-phosphate transport system permease protein